MASLPYVTSPGNIAKALNGIRTAAVPERVSQDFVKTVLKIPGGSGDQMTAFLKKIGFSDSNGKPTDLYTRYRNPNAGGAAVADAIRYAYAPLYRRNEFMHELGEQDILGLIVEETGRASDSAPVKLTLNCIMALIEFADFTKIEDTSLAPPEKKYEGAQPEKSDTNSSNSNVSFNLGYTINLNLPPSTDPAVFNAIFKSLKEHLLSEKDG